MNKILVAVLSVVIPLAAEAACTWTSTDRGVQGVCDTTPVAPSGSDGLALGGALFTPNVKAYVVHAETAGTMTAGGTLQAYLLNPVTSNWNRAPDLDVTVQALARQTFTGLSVNVSQGRVAYVASGVGVTVNIYINASN